MCFLCFRNTRKVYGKHPKKHGDVPPSKMVASTSNRHLTRGIYYTPIMLYMGGVLHFSESQC